MQLQLKKIPNRQGKVRENPLRLSSFSLINESGKIGIVKTLPLRFEIKERYIKRVVDFSSWCMPVQADGYIKCRKYDFF